MKKENKFDDIYMRAESGEFDRAYWDIYEGDKTGLDVNKIKKSCIDNGVDFDEFLKYAQKRKGKE